MHMFMQTINQGHDITMKKQQQHKNASVFFSLSSIEQDPQKKMTVLI